MNATWRKRIIFESRIGRFDKRMDRWKPVHKLTILRYRANLRRRWL